MADLSTVRLLDLIEPGNPGYDEARTPWLTNIEQRPAAIALPADADDMAAVVRRAARTGHRLALQSTGHHAHTLGGLERTILVRTTRMRSVSVDPQQRVARVGAGAVWSDVVTAAERHGLTPLAGSSGDVGVAGYALGGGLSWMSRRHGLACNNIVALDVITADGRHRRIDGDHEPELFWALRGGGGVAAAVTALELALVPITEFVAGAMFWPLERGPEILRAWRDWTEDVPDEVSSCGRLLRVPPLPEIPEPLRGRSFVVIESVQIGQRDAAFERLRPLRALSPEWDTTAPVGPTGLLRLHMDPDRPVPALFDGINLRTLPDEAIQALDAAAGASSGSTLRSVELRHLGGAAGRSAPGHGALARLDGDYAVVAVGAVPEPAASAGTITGLSRVTTALSPWRGELDYLNFSGHPVRPERYFGPTTASRLRDVARSYDPTGLFQPRLPVAA